MALLELLRSVESRGYVVLYGLRLELWCPYCANLCSRMTSVPVDLLHTLEGRSTRVPALDQFQHRHGVFLRARYVYTMPCYNIT
mmetsp:Transcript_42168/g.57556  ORF Transcript_42168/g.57556 Transcript_42168/m.57556 type:complete len:84 (-) Transcript_42168:44-295(-)